MITFRPFWFENGQKSLWSNVKKWVFVHLKWCGWIYVILGVYTIGNGISNIVLTFPKVL